MYCQISSSVQLDNGNTLLTSGAGTAANKIRLYELTNNIIMSITISLIIGSITFCYILSKLGV